MSKELIQFLKNYKERVESEGMIPTVELLIEELERSEEPTGYPDSFISEQEQQTNENNRN